LPSAIALTH